jgi:hypothetical protein
MRSGWAPALRFYTLGKAHATGYSLSLSRRPAVIEVDRLILPDYLDSQEILLRNGSVLERSPTGRWVSRLPLLATDLVTSRLATRAPRALVTDQGLGERPQYRIVIHVARMDINENGRASMDADWQILARDREGRSTMGRAHISIAGSTATDMDTVRLETVMFDRLADAISLPNPFLNRNRRSLATN